MAILWPALAKNKKIKCCNSILFISISLQNTVILSS